MEKPKRQHQNFTFNFKLILIILIYLSVGLFGVSSHVLVYCV